MPTARLECSIDIANQAERRPEAAIPSSQRVSHYPQKEGHIATGIPKYRTPIEGGLVAFFSASSQPKGPFVAAKAIFGM
jgi:hypothetical protein